MLSAMLMAMGKPEPVGQVVFDNTNSSQRTYDWTVPPRVTKIWAVAVGNHNTNMSQDSGILRGSTWLLSTYSPGANWTGGDGGTNSGTNRGGGGAGGYTGDGGNGSTGTAGSGSPGQGGGGGGGGAGISGGGLPGGGVGLLGMGANGSGGTGSFSPSRGGDGSVPPGPTAYGGGIPGNSSTAAGCSLRYTITAVPVTPGEVLQIKVCGVASGGNAFANGAVRIMWGGDRSYPNNAGDLPEVL